MSQEEQRQQLTRTIQATEGTSYIDPSFSTHYEGAAAAGLLRGGYHFAQPADSTGAEQAEYFIANGGGWSDDGITLPGMLDIEYAPSGDTCYGLSADAMVAWVDEFLETYKAATGIYPLIYTATNWWDPCTGSSTAFGEKSPLVVARYSDEVGQLPAGWSAHTFWQFNSEYSFGGDSQTFNGDEAGLKKIAKP